MIEDLLFIAQGVKATILISLLSFLIGFIIGVPIAILRELGFKPVKIASEIYEKFFRGIPVLVIMLWFYFGLGGVIPFISDPYTASIAALGLRSGAFQAQIFRGAINSVGREQMMAARSIGMSIWQAYRYVIIPQAFIVALPGLASEISLLIKDSSYSFILGVLDITKHADIVRRAHRSFVLPYVYAAILYIIITFPIANYLDRLGSRLKTRYGLR